MSKKRKHYHGKFTPRNPQKYKGDIHNIVFRSLWERSFMNFLDTHKSILAWGSETVIIPYRYSVDQKLHRYFVDFFIQVLDEAGNIKKYLIEIKPYAQTLPPVQKTKTRTNRYVDQVCEYMKNCDKWSAAREYCDKNGMKFEIITEKQLFNGLGIEKIK